MNTMARAAYKRDVFLLIYLVIVRHSILFIMKFQVAFRTARRTERDRERESENKYMFIMNTFFMQICCCCHLLVQSSIQKQEMRF